MTSIAGFTLSEQQRRVWAASAAAGLALPRAQCAVRLDGVIDRRELRAAIESIVARHEVLRTTFQLVDGMKFPLQIVHAALPLAWDEDAPVDAAAIAELCRSELALPFDPSCASPLRVLLARIRTRQHVVVLTLSALCGDCGTLQQIVRELDGEWPATGEADLQYLQLAAWQDEARDSEDAATGAALWRERSAAAGAAARAARLMFEAGGCATGYAYQERALDRGVATRLAAAAADHGVSLRALMLTAWHEVLRRFTASASLATWVTLDGREGGALATLCGPVAAAVPIAAPEPTREVRAYAAALDDALRTAAEWLPYYRPDVDPPSACPDLRFGFEYVELTGPIERDGVIGTLMRFTPAAPPGELHLACAAGHGSLQLLCTHDPGRFPPPYVASLLDAVAALLAGLDPTRALADAELVPADDARRLFGRINQPASPAPSSGVLHHRFEAQAARTPARIAVRCDRGALTFQELNRRANRLAHRLIALGARLEEPVALCLPRSSQLLVAILGILKAGGAYVPLHPDHPAERLRYVLDQTGARLVICDDVGAASPAFHDRLVVSLDDAPGTPADDSAPEVASAADHLAYIIYTSGSTGVPKGVEITHGSVINLLAALRERVYATIPRSVPDAEAGGLKVSLNAPIVFDASVKQWIQVLDGHTLRVIPEALRVDPAGLRRFVVDAGIDVLDCTPSLLRPLLAGDTDAWGPRAVLVGGEAVDSELWQAMVARHATAGTRFFNVYGPTECTVDATVGPVTGPGRPTIGHAIDHCSVYVLDDRLRPVPIGAPGELYIGGAGVARGYRDRPDPTAERFLPDPFSAAPGARMYRTGDLVWLRASGELEYLGRGDGQVKLRGYRIELDEIAVVLRQVAEVRDASAQVRGTGDDARLVAYVIPQAGAAISRDRLRAQLRQRLPEYMVPAAFVVVARWPLTANGKLDAGALPDPEAEAPAAGAAALGSATERTIAAIWQDVLGIDKVGPHDNFFDLGGHSLRMVKVHALLRGALQRDIQMVDLFRYPTIAALSQFFDRQTPGDAAAGQTSQTGASSDRGRRRISAVISVSNRKGKRRP